ncbi:MAG: hypothetical protein AAF304_09815 [Pseudomonadota bacterium]
MPTPDDAFYQQIVAAAAEAATRVAMNFVKEHLERHEKKNNVVVVGNKENCTGEMEQNADDTKKMEAICTKLAIPIDALSGTFREGRTRGKRVLKVCFKDRQVTARRTFLTNATRLMREESQCQGLRFQPIARRDMTEKEREQDRKLRGELRDRRAAGELNLIIRNGEIITRPTRERQGN